MRLVTLLRDAPAHGAFKGETLGLPDDVAGKLVAAGKAAYAPDPTQPPAAPEPKPEAAAEPEPADDEPDGDDDSEDEAKPARRGPGRPRKVS